MRTLIMLHVMPRLQRDQRLTYRDKFIRQTLQWEPLNTIRGHAQNLNIPRETMRRSIRRLVETGWAQIYVQPGTKTPIVLPSMPREEQHLLADQLKIARRELGLVGEGIMKIGLDLIVDDFDFRDNARPREFVTGTGSGRHEIDRLYRRARVGVEFQGRQHVDPDSNLHRDRNSFDEQQIRDYIKAGMCWRHGYKYVEVYAEELQLPQLEGKVRGLLPLRPIDWTSPVVRTYNALCIEYVNTINRNRRKEEEAAAARNR